MTVPTKTPASAVNTIRLAAWVAKFHPQLFRQLLAKARAARVTASKTAHIGVPTATLQGIGRAPGTGCDCPAPRTGLKRFGGFGGLLSDISSAFSDVGSSSGGFWSGLGSDLSSAGSSVMSGISDVGSYLGSSTGLSNLTSLANTYFGAQAASTQANMQQAVLNAQVQRTASGYSPAPVTYTTNAAGQVIPVMQSASGYSPLTTSGIASLASSGFPSWLPWVAAAGVGALILFKVL